MDNQAIVKARQAAEHAVRDMQDGPLKIAAFQTILEKLLASPEESRRATGTGKPRKATPAADSNSLRGRILTLKTDDYFQAQRGLGDVREELGKRGWHYPLTTLSGAMQVLTRRRELRREQVSKGGKRSWMYSNP